MTTLNVVSVTASSHCNYHQAACQCVWVLFSSIRPLLLSYLILPAAIINVGIQSNYRRLMSREFHAHKAGSAGPSESDVKTRQRRKCVVRTLVSLTYFSFFHPLSSGFVCTSVK
ncbi:hypothetical protein DFS33DRAFT_1361716 [Desarmillaria ectypa]|nr:hypothetical protein DFS33DRAFT_1361716 [Desarmillaria ectypa]